MSKKLDEGIIMDHAAKDASNLLRNTATAELLEAAKKADRWFSWYYEMGNGQQDEKKQTTWNQLKQAIAKAEGRD